MVRVADPASSVPAWPRALRKSRRVCRDISVPPSCSILLYQCSPPSSGHLTRRYAGTRGLSTEFPLAPASCRSVMHKLTSPPKTTAELESDDDKTIKSTAPDP